MKVLVDGGEENPLRCGRCKQYKDRDDFHKDSSCKRGRTFYCKVCANESAKLHWLERRKDPAYVKKHLDKSKAKYKEAKLRAIEYLGGKCADCKKEYPPYVYDFHHLDGSTKLDNPSRALRGDWEKAREELDKCVLLCSNCHRGRHFSDY